MEQLLYLLLEQSDVVIGLLEGLVAAKGTQGDQVLAKKDHRKLPLPMTQETPRQTPHNGTHCTHKNSSSWTEVRVLEKDSQEESSLKASKSVQGLRTLKPTTLNFTGQSSKKSTTRTHR